MNIATLLLNQGRGSGEVARQQSRHLVAQGHRVFFMHPHMGEGVAGAENLDVPLHNATMPVHEYLPAKAANQRAVNQMSPEEAFSYLADYEKALEAVASECDIFYGHHANLTAIATHEVARRHGKPFVLFLHGTGIEPRHHGQFHDEVWERIELAIREADGILVTTEYVRDFLIRNLIDLPKDRFIVLPCGVDLSEFHPDRTHGLDEFNLSDPFVLCPGALTAAKGPQNVVAASKFYADLAPTLFIGDGELRGELETELGDRGRFLGFVSADHKARLINRAAVLTAAPEKKEHFGIIYAEALAGGTPVAAYGGGGVDSIVSHEVGVLTERNPESLGRAIRSLLESPEQRRAMGAAGRLRAEAEYADHKLGARLEAWLDGFVQKAGC
ncbi:MAG: glycosyltransferase family 1 protein [Planctomycetota bacterium]|nr:MAG: glycosyltransferase family 1 protein [Planctomycetota bacterium]